LLVRGDLVVGRGKPGAGADEDQGYESACGRVSLVLYESCEQVEEECLLIARAQCLKLSLTYGTSSCYLPANGFRMRIVWSFGCGYKRSGNIIKSWGQSAAMGGRLELPSVAMLPQAGIWRNWLADTG